jgi:uncharacterized DUF497 family protein
MGRKQGHVNESKHGVGFDEASTVFDDPLSITIPDPAHSRKEFRYIQLGESSVGRLLVVVFTERRTKIRIISSREATRTERKQYEEGDF